LSVKSIYKSLTCFKRINAYSRFIIFFIIVYVERIMTGKAIISCATHGDAFGGVTLLRRSISLLCHNDHLNDPPQLEEWLRNKTGESFLGWLSDDLSRIFKAEINGELAGICSVSIDNREIQLMYIDPAFQGQGVSSQMLSFCEGFLFNLASSPIYLKSTKTALEFYLKRGWNFTSGDIASRQLTKSI